MRPGVDVNNGLEDDERSTTVPISNTTAPIHCLFAWIATKHTHSAVSTEISTIDPERLVLLGSGTRARTELIDLGPVAR
jgi:hypothetical protein